MKLHIAGAALLAAWLGSETTAQTPFTEEGLSRGVTYFTQHYSWSLLGYGVLLVDADNDGAPDAIPIGGFMDLPGLFHNNGSGLFTDVSASSDLPPIPFSSGALAFDYDADGDLDFFFTSYGSRDVMARNEGNLTFTNVSTELGVNGSGLGGGASAGDVDGDGWLELHVTNYGEPDYYYDNSGGTFTEMGTALGLDSDWRGLQSVFFDMDRDGDPDLYVSIDKKDAQEVVQRNLLYENVDGQLIDISAGSGSDVNIFSMGVAVGDFLGNGLPDLYNANLPDDHAPLLINQGGGYFRDLTTPWDVGNFRLAWATLFLDYDNDSFTDLYICNTVDTDPRNRLYRHNGTPPAVDIAPLVGLASPLNTYTCAIGDIDNDGDLDLLSEEANNWIQLYVNHEGENRNWIKFRLEGRGRNPFAVGADVSIRTATKWQYRELMVGGNGYKSTNDLTLHFGVGFHDAVDEVIVRWPNGVIQRMEGLAVNRTYRVVQGLSRSTGPGPGPVQKL